MDLFDIRIIFQGSGCERGTHRVSGVAVKNAQGENSPKTARRALSARARAWIDIAGIEGIPLKVAIEVDHSRIDGPEDARALGIRHVSDAAGTILTAAGGAS